MTSAIIRYLANGEHFLAILNDSGDAVEVSPPLPIADEFGRDRRPDSLTPVEWDSFGYADTEPWDDPSQAWSADRFTVVYRF